MIHRVMKEIRAAAEAQGLRQRDMATRADIAEASINRAFAGGRQPTLTTLAKMADAVGGEVTLTPKKQEGGVT